VLSTLDRSGNVRDYMGLFVAVQMALTMLYGFWVWLIRSSRPLFRTMFR
jgi:hypothetical protein